MQSLGEPYAELTHKRMDDRQKRRDHLSEIGIKSATENIGTVFSPFHSLELSVSLKRIFKEVISLQEWDCHPSGLIREVISLVNGWSVSLLLCLWQCRCDVHCCHLFSAENGRHSYSKGHDVSAEQRKENSLPHIEKQHSVKLANHACSCHYHHSFTKLPCN